jgi:hypothetical protein
MRKGYEGIIISVVMLLTAWALIAIAKVLF